MLNVVFNIYNKKVLNIFPYPWLTSMFSLATGSLIMPVFWAARVTEPPKTDLVVVEGPKVRELLQHKSSLKFQPDWVTLLNGTQEGAFQ
ncbi:hypothetical protein ZIOFF_031579 [Zingiber officinale]|uniref:Sugar phosphate transporter domain-containing protein n=1 Tax=Zingiber officinale TaxID=94328 RepID=A0A8J5LA35_ZINOF|nr:hypothetical protein ZIOFF_031579 [Zingiber officinale]